MRHELYASLDEMLTPETLSALEGRPVTAVCCAPFPSSFSLSGCCEHFLRLETNGERPYRYVVKRISQEWDWIMRATDDRHGREVVLWQYGLLDQLPQELAHAVVACAVDGPGWAILLRDVSAALVLSYYEPIPREDNARFLDALAALHATFWDGRHGAGGAPGLCSLWHRCTWPSPQTGRREAGSSDELPPLLLEGWETLKKMIDPDVADVVYDLLDNPQPLCDVLGRYPQTLVHGDARRANLGVLQEEPPRVVCLDWQLAGLAPPCVDLAWYLADNELILPVPKDVAVACYRDNLACRLGSSFDEQWWEPQLELSLLAGFLQHGWRQAVDATLPDESYAARTFWRSELAWWSRHIRSAAEWL
jgi:hypothetical protein